LRYYEINFYFCLTFFISFFFVNSSEAEDFAPVEYVNPLMGTQSTHELDTIQKEMIGYNNLIRPYYAPKISVETIDDQNILVMWVPA